MKRVVVGGVSPEEQAAVEEAGRQAKARKQYREFACTVCGNALEDYGLTVGYVLGRSAMTLVVYRDSSRTAVKCTATLPFEDILNVIDDYELYEDLVDDTVNSLAKSASRGL